jgi:hypothetical protein
MQATAAATSAKNVPIAAISMNGWTPKLMAFNVVNS